MKRSLENEMMDLPDQPAALLREDLRNLRAINRHLGGYQSVMKGLGWLVGKEQWKNISLLDIGAGSGDVSVFIARWARRMGIGARLVALEPNQVTLQVAMEQTRAWLEIALVRGDGCAPPFRLGAFDIVLASQLLHHFTEEKIVALLRRWSELAKKAIIVGDLVRHPLAYHGIRLITRLVTRNVMTLNDAPLSVRRAFTLEEWHELFERAGVGPFRLVSVFPFRMVAVIRVGSNQ